MKNGILIIAHAPLASALRQCALHVYPEAARRICSVDVPAAASLDDTVAQAKNLMATCEAEGVLLLTDVLGASPCNVARSLADGVQVRLVTGVNLPMLLRALNYLDQDLEVVVGKAMAGGVQGVSEVACALSPATSSK